jgi:hypothetical protein
MRQGLIHTCRGCGCTDLRACVGGCSWALLDIHSPTGVCTTCAEEVGWDPVLLFNLGYDEPGDDLGGARVDFYGDAA